MSVREVSRQVEPNSREIRNVLAEFATGVTIVTAPGSPTGGGATVNSFASVSLDPPLVLFCLCAGSRTGGLIRRSRAFGVNILSRQQKEMCLRFAGGGPERRFAEGDTVPGETGAPVLVDALACLDCEVAGIQRQGDHDLILGRVRAARTLRGNADPLIFFRGTFH